MKRDADLADFALSRMLRSPQHSRRQASGPHNRAPWRAGGICAAAGLACALAGCGAAQSGQAQDPQRQALAEYDIARDLLLNREQPREALRHSLDAQALDDSNPDINHFTALVYLDLCRRSERDCRLDAAETHARRALELLPDFLESRNTLGVIQIHAGRPGEAIETLLPLTRAMLYRTPEVAWGNLGWAQLKLGQFEQAATSLERSVSAQPDFCVGHFRLGLARRELGQLAAAEHSFTQALESAAGRCRGLQAAYWHRGQLRQARSEIEAAKSDFKACVALSALSQEGQACKTALRSLASPPARPHAARGTH